ncbi:MDR family MFS transporter [Streptomyces sp. NPDC092296]|uniref:MDR family MFS transporter n=1 Tax=Streptomyces sp. NPDC092296 TaxID=3366012 RepID=UPI00381D5860
MTHRQIMVVMIGLMLGMFLAALDQSIVGTAMPKIVSQFNGLDHMSWTVTAYLLTSTASVPLYGKISDQIGRRPVYLFAIVIFLIGSALAGMSQSMSELIGFRAVQGLGGGGLMSLSLAIIGDVIPPRDRGRYQGMFGAVFAVSSVAGPLLGGFFTDHLSWRWIFYINLPVGVVALFVAATVLKVQQQKQKHTIDWTGAALLVGGVTALLLVTSWSGTANGWGSATTLGLGAAGVIALVVFALVERRAAEPIMPPHLFRNHTFSLTSGIGFVVGLAMFGAIIYLPIYLQVVRGDTPTGSGLRMIPMMIGLLGASIISGRVISKTGKYKIWPILGTAITVVGLALLSRVRLDTSMWLLAAFMVLMGIGLGCVMQVLVLAVQNSVEMKDMGTATAGSTFFRSIGGAFGTAIFGTVLTSRLNHHISEGVAAAGLKGSGAGAPGLGGGEQLTSGGRAAIEKLPTQVQDIVLTGFVKALDDLFLVGIPFVAVALLLSFFIREVPLRGQNGPGAEKSEQVAMPVME